MPGSARPCWTGSPIAPTFSRPARNPIDSGGRPKNAIGRRKRRKATKLSCGNDGPWKAWKPQERFPTLSPPLGNPATAAGFPHSHSYGGGPYSYGKAKQKPCPIYNVPRWAKLNRRNGPKEVAKGTKRAEAVANDVMGFLQMISGSLGAGMVDQPTVDHNTVIKLFSQVSPSADAPMQRDWNTPRLSWLSAMAYWDELCMKDIDRLLQLGRFLDSELIKLLYEIDDSRHSAGMQSARQVLLPNVGTIQNSNLLAWADNYYECYEIARRLREYCE